MTFYHFPRLYLYFPDFFQVWEIAGQIWSLFQEFKTLYEPCKKIRQAEEVTTTHNELSAVRWLYDGKLPRPAISGTSPSHSFIGHS